MPNDRPTINELILAYLKHARDYYRPNHGENKEAGCINDALAVLQEQGYGREPADAFRPRDLKKVREAMVAKNWCADLHQQPSQPGQADVRLCRGGRPGIPAPSTTPCSPSRGCGKGRRVFANEEGSARPRGHVKAVLGKAHAVLKAMLLFAYRTGARPGEVGALKPVPPRPATARSGSTTCRPRPTRRSTTTRSGRCTSAPGRRKILEPWLEGLRPRSTSSAPPSPSGCGRRPDATHAKPHSTPPTSSGLETKRKLSPKRPKRDHYDPISLRRAVKRLCNAAKVPSWTPNRLRHNAATRFRAKYGIEVARILLGHRKVHTTEIYAEPDARKAMRAALDMG